MAGHSHWAGIKHRKAAQDKKRSKYFSKYSKALMIAAKDGGSDPDQNLKLRYAIDRAKAGNMPNASIERAIKKGAGELANKVFHEIMYEGYGPGGVAIMAEVVTDNRNRTAPEIRKAFSKNGGNLGSPGSVTFMFDHKGLLAIPKDQAEEEDVFEVAIEAGAEDVTPDDEQYQIVTAPRDFDTVKKAFAARDWTLTVAELAWVPQTEVCPSVEDAAKVEALLNEIEENDDVTAVHTNFSPPAPTAE